MDLSVYANCEVWGASIDAYCQAFRQYPTVLEKYLQRVGVLSAQDLETFRTQWHPMEGWLRATYAIVDEVGASTAYAVGKRIADTPLIPPEIDSAFKVLTGLDVLYHMHHRRDGSVMFDAATGVMIQGIGNFKCEILEAGSSASLVCDDPYPCDFNRGILAGFAGRFESAVSVTHVTGACKKRGDDSCSYLVQW